MRGKEVKCTASQIETFCVLIVLWIILVISINACAKPKVSDLVGKGINCKANIEMPEGWAYEAVEVKVKIYDCTEAKRDAG